MTEHDWESRVQKEARYTPQSGGDGFTFIFEDVSDSFKKLTKGFEFPGQAGTYVQDLGRSGRKFPLQCIFWGDDHDLQANAFQNALAERGVGVLLHPFYGQFNVVPFGTIERTDNLKTGANQTIIKVTFWETSLAVFLTGTAQETTFQIAEEKLDVLNEQSPSQFDDLVDAADTSEVVTFRDQVVSQVTNVRTGLKAVADTTAEVQRQFDAIYDSITQGIEEIVGTPLTLGFQILQLAQTPARAAGLIADKLEAYNNLLNFIIGRTITITTLDNTDRNEFANFDQSGQSVVSGAALAVLSTEFATQTAAIEAADTLATQLDEWDAWREPIFTALGVIDTGEAYQALQDFIGATLGALVTLGLQLPQERSVILTSDRNVIELVAEFYGTIDDRLDEFIAQNQLTGDEVLELPVGRRVVYYV